MLKELRVCGLAALLCVSVVAQAQAQEYDVVILSGRVMDPETRLDAFRTLVINRYA
jgi:hypothetical protein